MLCFLRWRLRNIYLLESSYEPFGAREVTVIFLVGRWADKPDSPSFQIRLQHVRGIHCALTCCTSAYQCMNLVDIHNILVALLLDAIHDLLDAILKVATILSTRQQRSDVKLINSTAFQSFRHLALLYHACQSPYEGSLSHTRLTHMQWIIFVAPAQYLYCPGEFLLTAY